MYEDLYFTLTEEHIQAYADRIGISLPIRPDVKHLDQIIYQHQCRIPFENLDVFDRKITPSLNVYALYDKIVTRKRGGYCFELNALLCHFLRAAGYEAYACSCRILRGKSFIPPRLHQAILVRIQDTLYYCDVGYGGPQPAGAVPVVSGAQKIIRGETFFMEQSSNCYWTLSRITSEGMEEKVIQFTTQIQEAVNFVPINFYCANHPDCVFTQKRLVNLRLPDGSLALTDMTFTRRKNGSCTTKELTTQKELEEVLSEQFGICSF